MIYILLNAPTDEKSWNEQMRSAVVQFITGSSKLPLDKFSVEITLATGSSDALPSSHTCFNQLVLPSYQKLETLREKMFYAIREAADFQLT